VIPGVILKTRHTRVCVMFSEVEPGVFMIEPMHFIKPAEAKRQADALFARPRRPA
jgi:hypothetical protein